MNKKRMKETLKRALSIKHIAGLVLGVVAGYIYYRTVGCASGACPITGNPWLSMLWGGLMGYFVADLIPAARKKQSPPPES